MVCALLGIQNGEEPMSEDRQKQSELETSYDKVWGNGEKEKRTKRW